jgi:uncharacterized protein involved in cysteine biosynthesis
MIEMLKARQIWIFILFALMLTIILAGLFRASFQMILGEKMESNDLSKVSSRTRWLTQVPACIFLLTVLLLSAVLLTPAANLFKDAASLLGGGL